MPLGARAEHYSQGSIWFAYILLWSHSIWFLPSRVKLNVILRKLLEKHTSLSSLLELLSEKSPSFGIKISDYCLKIDRSYFEIIKYQSVYWYSEITFMLTRREALLYNWNRTCRSGCFCDLELSSPWDMSWTPKT